MLPDHPLLRRSPLHSVRLGTTFDPESLVLRFDKHEATNVVDADRPAEELAEPRLLDDDSLITMLHEGIHWRQLNGTTVGAFLSWLKHAREIDVFAKLRALPEARRAELLQRRRAGQTLLALDDDGLPEPPIVLADPVDEVELLRVTADDEESAWRLFVARADKGYSFTDCTSFVLMRRLGIGTAITIDRHFAKERFTTLPASR